MIKISGLKTSKDYYLFLGLRKESKEVIKFLYKSHVEEILNIQEKGGKAKPYQIKQVRNLILKYKLKLDEDEN